MMFTLNFPPRTKKNHTRKVYSFKHRRTLIVPGEAYEAYETAVVKAMRALGYIQRPKGMGKKDADAMHARMTDGLPDHLKPISRPVNVKATYCIDAARTTDLNGLNQALHDALVAAGVLHDDSAINPEIIVSTDGTRVVVDRKNPRTEVEITDAV